LELVVAEAVQLPHRERQARRPAAAVHQERPGHLEHQLHLVRRPRVWLKPHALS
jgi:hypothetical protein